LISKGMFEFALEIQKYTIPAVTCNKMDEANYEIVANSYSKEKH